MLKLERNNEKIWITATERKYFPLALEWCNQNGKTACKVNRINFVFDFENMKCGIESPYSRFHWYNMENR